MDSDFRRRGLRGFSVNRLIPNVLTLAALCSGLTAIRFALQSEFHTTDGVYFERKGPVLAVHTRAAPHAFGAVKVADESKRLLRSVVSEVFPFTIETADHYARIRGTLSIPPADAIHMASAAQAGTDLFLTNDKSLIGKIVPGIQFIASLDTQLF